MWYVYFLELSNGDVYIGSTNDLRRRFKSHQQARWRSPVMIGIRLRSSLRSTSARCRIAYFAATRLVLASSLLPPRFS